MADETGYSDYFQFEAQNSFDSGLVQQGNATFRGRSVSGSEDQYPFYLKSVWGPACDWSDVWRGRGQ